METDRASNCIIDTEKRSGGSAATGFTPNSKRHLMDFANACPNEGSAPAVSAVPDMSSAVPAMGWVMYFPAYCKRAGRRPV